MTDFYVRYNRKTLVPDMISGSPIDANDPRARVAKITQTDAEDFLLMRKQMHLYVVVPSKKYVSFKTKDEPGQYTRNKDSSIVTDLSHQETLFNQFGIRFVQDGRKVTLTFNYRMATDNAQDSYDDLMNANDEVDLYVSKFLTPLVIIAKMSLSLSELKKKKKIVLDIGTEQRVSIYATRNGKKNV